MKHIVFICSVIFLSGCYDFSLPSKPYNDSGGDAAGYDGAVSNIQGTEGIIGNDVGGGTAATGGTSSTDGDAQAKGTGDASSEEPCASENALRCSNSGVGQREICQGGTWKLTQPCASGEICSSQEKPGTCIQLAAVCKGSAGKPVCDGKGVMYKCNSEGVIESQDTCKSARLCQAGLTTGKCPMCIPGEFRCSGKQLEICNNSGSAFASKKKCETEALCNAKAGECTASACLPGKLVCEGDVLSKCNAEQTAFVKDKTCKAGLCDGVAGECDVCTPGEKTCEGDTVVTCNAQGQGYTRSPCSGSKAQCIGAGECVACTQDSECPAPGTCKQRYCNTAKGTCEPRNTADHESCGGGVCSNGICIGCLANSDCASSSAKYCVDQKCKACDPKGSNSCGVCKKCTADGSCSNFNDNTQDPAGCDGKCEACQKGKCSNATDGSNPGNLCSKTASNAQPPCLDGTCSSGACKTYAPITCYQDSDGDTYGVTNLATQYCSSSCPSKTAGNNGDCNDANTDVHPNQKKYFIPSIPNTSPASWDYDCSGWDDAETRVCKNGCSSGTSCSTSPQCKTDTYQCTSPCGGERMDIECVGSCSGSTPYCRESRNVLSPQACR